MAFLFLDMMSGTEAAILPPRAELDRGESQGTVDSRGRSEALFPSPHWPTDLANSGIPHLQDARHRERERDFE